MNWCERTPPNILLRMLTFPSLGFWRKSCSFNNFYLISEILPRFPTTFQWYVLEPLSSLVGSDLLISNSLRAIVREHFSSTWNKVLNWNVAYPVSLHFTDNGKFSLAFSAWLLDNSCIDYEEHFDLYLAEEETEGLILDSRVPVTPEQQVKIF